MLERDDIDAVSIATPDHWHAIPTIWAAQRGKDVHIEKPLSLTIQQGHAMVDAVRRYDRVCQVGSEARSNPRCRFACELVRNGRIGEVKEVKYANGVLMYHVLGGATGDFYRVPGTGFKVLCTRIKDVPEMLDDVTIVGTEGRVGLSYNGLSKTDPPSLIHDRIGPDEIHLYECPPGGHMRGDFWRSVRTRQKPGADIEIGHRTVSVCHLAHIAYRLGRPLKWDPVKEQFIGDEAANCMCSRAMRGTTAGRRQESRRDEDL